MKIKKEIISSTSVEDAFEELKRKYVSSIESFKLINKSKNFNFYKYIDNSFEVNLPENKCGCIVLREPVKPKCVGAKIMDYEKQEKCKWIKIYRAYRKDTNELVIEKNYKPQIIKNSINYANEQCCDLYITIEKKLKNEDDKVIAEIVNSGKILKGSFLFFWKEAD